MRGTKAKALKKISYAVGGDQLPETAYVSKPFDKQFAVGDRIVTLQLRQIFLGKCKRKVYQDIKKIYKISQRQGLAHA